MWNRKQRRTRVKINRKPNWIVGKVTANPQTQFLSLIFRASNLLNIICGNEYLLIVLLGKHFSLNFRLY